MNGIIFYVNKGEYRKLLLCMIIGGIFIICFFAHNYHTLWIVNKERAQIYLIASIIAIGFSIFMMIFVLKRLSRNSKINLKFTENTIEEWIENKLVKMVSFSDIEKVSIVKLRNLCNFEVRSPKEKIKVRYLKDTDKLCKILRDKISDDSKIGSSD